jgi:hypothetical protein
MTALFDGRSATEHAEAAAEAVRAINHITGWPPGRGLAYPSEAYRVLGQLATVAARLPQACTQIIRQLITWDSAGQLGFDPGTTYAGHPAAAVVDAMHRLDDAVRAARYLEHALAEATHVLTYAHHTDPGPELDLEETD